MSDGTKKPNTSDSIFPPLDYIVLYAWGFAEPFFKLVAWLFLVAGLIAASGVLQNYLLWAIAAASGIVWGCAVFAKCVHFADFLSDRIDDWIDNQNLRKTKSKFAHTFVILLKISLRVLVGYSLICFLLSVFAIVPDILLVILTK